MSQSIRGDDAIHTVLPYSCRLDSRIPVRIREHLQRLRLIVPVISVSVLALRGQNAELDEDVARVLQQHAGAALDLEIEEMQVFLDSFGAQGARGVSHEHP